MHRLHPNWLYTVPTKTTLILLTLLTESRCACNFRPNSGSACPKFFTARSRINFWALIRWFPMFSTNRSLSSGFSTFKDSVVLENHVHRLLFSEQLFFKKTARIVREELKHCEIKFVETILKQNLNKKFRMTLFHKPGSSRCRLGRSCLHPPSCSAYTLQWL